MIKYSKFFCSIMIILCTTITACSEECPRRTKQYPLHEAAAAGDCARVALLLDQGLKVHARDGNKETPIHVAAKNGHTAVVELLLNKDSRISVRGKDDQTPLHYACQQGNVDTVRLLISRKARLGAMNKKDNQTPLHCAAENGHASIVEIFLDHPTTTATVNTKSWYWHLTPLHYACIQGHVPVVRLLLERKAKKNLCDKDGHTPLYYAADRGHFDVCVMLCEGSDLDDSLHIVCGTPSEAPIQGLVEHLLSKGADCNSQDNNLQTPLHVAAKSGNLLAVTTLVSAGAQLNARNKNQQTPLHIATCWGHAEVVSYLLRKDAATDLIDKKNMTPLAYAIAAAIRDRQAINNYHRSQILEGLTAVCKRPIMHRRIRTIYCLLGHGVYINKTEKKYLDIFLPGYPKLIQVQKKRLATVLEDTYVAALPQDLIRLLLEFIVSQTDKKRTRDAHSSDDGPSHKKNSN